VESFSTLPFFGNLDYRTRYNDLSFPDGHMNCSEFLHRYSDYRDGLITDAQALRHIRVHVATCARCGRYDDSLRRGIGGLGDIEPSSTFRDRLRARLSRGDLEAAELVGMGTAGIAASLMVAAAVALFFYSRKGGDLDTPTKAASADSVAGAVPRAFPLVVANPGVPFVTFTELPSSPFRMVGTTSDFSFQDDVPLGTWANLPH
jgi:hypothetical protein